VTPGYESVSLVDRTVTRFPQTYDELMRLDLIAGLDVAGRLLRRHGGDGQGFCGGGGSLLLTGGYYAYGGTFEGSPLEPLLPVELGGAFSLAKASPAQTMEVTEEGRKILVIFRAARR